MQWWRASYSIHGREIEKALSHLASPWTAKGSRAEQHDQSGGLPCDLHRQERRLEVLHREERNAASRKAFAAAKTARKTTFSLIFPSPRPPRRLRSTP